MAPVQEHRPVAVSSPLGEDVLLFRTMTARERLGRLFEIDLEVLSENFDIGLNDVLGQPFSIRMDLPDDATRYFHAYATRFCFIGQHRHYARYRATLHPWFWFLSRTADCRIFQKKTAPEIIQEIFRDAGFSDFKNSLAGSYRTWEYCVQYRESDLNFISRLMENEGIYYYFLHEEGKHTLVLADAYDSHAPAPGYKNIPYYPPGEKLRRERDHISDWSVSQQVQTGKYVLDDFDFERPKTDLQTRLAMSRRHPRSDFEVFDYPGAYLATADGDEYVKARLQELQAEYERTTGEGNARGLAVGAFFSLEGYPRADQNREYLVVSATHELKSNAYETEATADEVIVYHCSFTAQDSRQPYRSPRITPKSKVQGPQTAMVVGPAGEEIYTDKYGRVKVQFHWDRYGKSDENSSCWVRVAQVWAGKNWGAMHVPRIGQEVIVDFLEGDPDRPIVVGRVYNGDNMPPYALPDNQTQSGLKSRSTKEGDGETFNELRFEDKKGAEHIYFHAEKDFQRVVENNDTLKVGFEKKDQGDQTIEIFNNQSLTVGGSEAADGSQTIQVWKNRTLTVKEGNDATVIEKGHRTVTVSKGNETTTIREGNHQLDVDKGDHTVNVKTGNRNVTIKADDTLKIEQGNRTVEVGMGHDALTVKTGNLTIKASMGKVSIEAMQGIELKVGSNSVKIDPAGVTVQGTMVKVQGQAQTQVAGAITQINGTGMLMMKGGIAMIN